jgi:hypothetical protein
VNAKPVVFMIAGDKIREREEQSGPHMKRVRANSDLKEEPVSVFPLRSFASCSLEGTKSKVWENQDSVVMYVSIGGVGRIVTAQCRGEDSSTRSILLACLDGHGEFGAQISQVIFIHS